MFKCVCGREFEKSLSLNAHKSHCEKYLGRKPVDRFEGKRGWARGRTVDDPVYGESIKKIVDKLNKYTTAGMKLNIVDREKFKRQSETRKKRYLSGELVPAAGVGRGKYSYLLFDNKRIMLRSSYEFIYALYLLYKHIEFEYETVRVKAVSDCGYSVFISDFKIGNNIIEIKGYKSAKIYHAKKAFESAGYTYEVKYWEDLQQCIDYLNTKVDLNEILTKIEYGHDSRNYYEHIFVDA